MLIHDTKYPYWDQVSLNSINQPTFALLPGSLSPTPASPSSPLSLLPPPSPHFKYTWRCVYKLIPGDIKHQPTNLCPLSSSPSPPPVSLPPHLSFLPSPPPPPFPVSISQCPFPVAISCPALKPQTWTCYAQQVSTFPLWTHASHRRKPVTTLSKTAQMSGYKEFFLFISDIKRPLSSIWPSPLYSLGQITPIYQFTPLYT